MNVFSTPSARETDTSKTLHATPEGSDVTYFGAISLLLTKSFVTDSPPGCTPVCLIVRSCSAVSSTGFSIYSQSGITSQQTDQPDRRMAYRLAITRRTDRIRPAPSFAIHLFLNARAWPTFDDSSPTNFYPVSLASQLCPMSRYDGAGLVISTYLQIWDGHRLSTWCW